MKFTWRLGAITLLIAASFASCKKYDEGPLVSLTPRAERAANTWIISYAEEDGENVSTDYDEYELYMNKDGDAELEANYTAFGVDYSTTTNGTWSFTSEEENLLVDFEDDDQDNEFRILRLKNDELWLKDLDQDLELHLLSK